MRTHARARRFILRVTEAGDAKLTVPRRATRREIEAFLAEHTQWLIETSTDARASADATQFVPPEVLNLAAVSEQWHVEWSAKRPRRKRVELRPSTSADNFTLRLLGEPAASDVGLAKEVRAVLIDRARDFFSDQIAALAPAMGVEVKRLQVRNQRSVWGSCSSKGTLSMNYAALYLEPRVARYLCVHELAHLKHMNHSQAFWRFVLAHEPSALELDRSLGGTRDVVPPWLW